MWEERAVGEGLGWDGAVQGIASRGFLRRSASAIGATMRATREVSAPYSMPVHLWAWTLAGAGPKPSKDTAIQVSTRLPK